MNIFTIALKEIKHIIRDKKALAFMIAFPLVLMLVLGTALSGVFSNEIKVDSMHVLYKDNANKQTSSFFTTFVKIAKESDIHFTEDKGDHTDFKKINQNKYDGYLELNQTGVKLYLNERNSINGSILQGMVSSFVDKYNIASEIVKIAPENLNAFSTSTIQPDFIKDVSLDPKKEPGSMDYYAIVMTTMIALYGVMSAGATITSERTRKTANRLISSPITKSEIFIGKVLGVITTNMLFLVIIVAFSKYVYKANWGDHLGSIFLVLFTETILAASIGIAVSYVIKSDTGLGTILTIFAQLASFFGGAYFKIEGAEGIFKFLIDLSPLTWQNTAITKIIYSNDLSAAIPAISYNLIASLILFTIAIVSLQRREGF